MESWILLDVDGALCPNADLRQPTPREDARPEYGASCVDALGDVVLGCGAQLVLTSSWRGNVERRAWAEAQIVSRGRILQGLSAITPLSDGDRAVDILEWAAERMAPSALCCWVAVDAQNLAGQLPSGHFLQIDSARGLTTGDADEIMELLRKQAEALLEPSLETMGLSGSTQRRRGGGARSMLGRLSAFIQPLPTGGSVEHI